MGYAFLLGRILFGGFFLRSAWNHFKNLNMMAGYAASRGVPAPKLSVGGSGVLLLIGGLGVLFGVYVRWALGALVLFLLPVTLMMHSFWKDSDPHIKAANSVNFYKNLALLGAVLMLYLLPLPWPLSLVK